MSILTECKVFNDERESSTQISIALEPYIPKFRMVKHFSKLNEKSYNIDIILGDYPFISVDVDCSSINLINVAIVQAMFVHFDNDVLQGLRKGFWQNISDYRKRVCAGHWIVPKMSTNIYRKIPLEKEISLITSITKYRNSPKRYYLWFEAESQSYFNSNGIAVFENKEDSSI